MFQTLTDEFVDLILQDDDLLNAEFEAIIDGEWRDLPPAPSEQSAAATNHAWLCFLPRPESELIQPTGSIQLNQSNRQRAPPRSRFTSQHLVRAR